MHELRHRAPEAALNPAGQATAGEPLNLLDLHRRRRADRPVVLAADKKDRGTYLPDMVLPDARHDAVNRIVKGAQSLAAATDAFNNYRGADQKEYSSITQAMENAKESFVVQLKCLGTDQLRRLLPDLREDPAWKNGEFEIEFSDSTDAQADVVHLTWGRGAGHKGLQILLDMPQKPACVA
jgi:hypothetical protein